MRKAGNRVRITAQLIKADDGTHIWAEDYDRDLTDVFAIQEDIARAITASLHMTLGLKPGEELINQRQIDAALHDQYLRAKNLVRTRQGEPTAEAIRLLNDVVARNPGYAPAWAALALAYEGSLVINLDVASESVERAKPVIQDLQPKIEAVARQAVKLDPNNAEAYCGVAAVLKNRDSDHVAAMDLYRRALTLDPDDPECLNGASIELAALGFVKQALSMRAHLLALEPFVPVYRNVAARILFADGQSDAATEMLNSAPRGGAGAAILRAQIYAAEGRYGEAADLLVSIKVRNPALTKTLTTAARLQRTAPKGGPPDDRPELGVLNWVYFYTGAPERGLNTYENETRMGFYGGPPDGLEFAPAYHAMRQTDRFKKWVRDAGILAYWQAKGWLPQCHPTVGDDFECS